MSHQIKPHLLYTHLYLSEALKSQLEENLPNLPYTMEDIEVALALKSTELKKRLEKGDPLLPFASIEALEKGLDWEDEEKDNMCLEDIIQTLIPFFLWLSVIFRLLK